MGMEPVVTEELIARQSPEAQAIIRALLAKMAEMEAELRELRGQVKGKTPRNSSLPPSTQHPHAKPRREKRKSKKRRGGQPGQPKHERPLIPTEQCDHVQPLKPTKCRRCGEKLSGSDPEPLRHQVWELPEIKPHVSEYQRHRLGCPACGETTCAELPAGVPQDQVNADETPTKEENGKAWLWTFVARMFTVFAVRATREATAVDELLTAAFRGVVTCDRAKMYWRVGRLQWCWAHLKRDFQALIDSGDNQAKRLGHDLRRMTCKLFEHWANYRDGTIRRAAFARRMAPVRREVDRLLLRGVQSGNPSLVGMCRELYAHRDWLGTFVRCEGVEPTNNAGERALRHAVIWRKLSFGTQSASGSRFVETMLTVIETCRQQRHNAFEYLTAAVHSHLAHQPTPSLLPGA